jgi:hypothetical protein
MRQPRIAGASSFRNLAEAERFVSDALRREAAGIQKWAANAAIGRDYQIIYRVGQSVGYGVLRSTGALQEMTSLRIFLRKTVDANRIYFVLTAHPIP